MSLLTTLAAIHDIGKFAPHFQAKVPDLWKAISGATAGPKSSRYHTQDGLCLWIGSLSRRLGPTLWSGDSHFLTRLVQAVMGHHGRPLALDRESPNRIFGIGRDPAEQFAEAVQRLLMPRPASSACSRDSEIDRATWWLAGLVTTADWIGSNERWFPYTAPMADDTDLRAYWACARERAAGAIRAAGLEAPTAAASRTFVELTAARWSPTAAQQWAMKVELPSGPTLFLLEDVMGAGKTEAAQILVHRLMAAGRASGAFWAMPTQATANAMYERQGNMVRALFNESSPRRPSLVLAHSKSRMHAGFRDTVVVEPGSVPCSSEADDSDLPSEVACAAFLANSSRAALIADVGAGTVDQAVLAVLPSKFNTVRLFGLAEKVLVLDEIHAYDAYMSEELRALLRFHAALGGCVVALSATLSSKLAGSLINEWRQATLAGSEPVPATTAYPLATVVSGDAVVRSSIRAADWSHRTTPVCLINDESAAIERLLSAARAGAAVVWIRNTVDSCRAAATILRDRGAADVTVFHARFAQIDRQRREEDVLARFGRSPSKQREGSILVATQVVEQSLDLDFDVMLSDLAPIDLLVQRSGRLWRHSFRANRLGVSGPELLVLAPDFEEDPRETWLDDLLPKTKWVYQDAGVLWRTLRALRSTGHIQTPDGLRGLIAQVYDNQDCPRQLQESADRADGRARAATATARQYTLRIDEGYVDTGLIWSSDTHVPTRLGDHQSVVRLGRLMNDGRVVPWADDSLEDWPAWHGWALSEIRVSRRRLPADSQPPEAIRAACDAARATWGRWEQEIGLVPLRQEGEAWIGTMIRPDGSSIEIEYEANSGLTFGGNPDSR